MLDCQFFVSMLVKVQLSSWINWNLFYNKAFKDSSSHTFLTCFPMIASNGKVKAIKQLRNTRAPEEHFSLRQS